MQLPPEIKILELEGFTCQTCLRRKLTSPILTSESQAFAHVLICHMPRTWLITQASEPVSDWRVQPRSTRLIKAIYFQEAIGPDILTHDINIAP